MQRQDRCGRVWRAMAAAGAAWLLAATGTASAEASIQRFAADRYVNAVATDGTTVFWKSTCGDDFSGSRSFIRRRSATGGATRTLFHPAGCRGDRAAGASFDADDQHVFWLGGDGLPRRLARDASVGDAPQRLTTSGGAPTSGFCCELSTGGSRVFFSRGDELFSVSKAGGERRLFDRAPGGAEIRALDALVEDDVIYLAGGRLRRARSHRTDTLGTSVSAFAAGDERIYYAERAGSGWQVVSLRRPDFGDRRVHATLPGVLGVAAMAVDAGHVYWHERRSDRHGGPIMRKRLADASVPEAISEWLIAPDALRLAAGHLFWADNDGVARLPVGAPPEPPPGDVRLTGLEVVQSMQTPDGRIPLLSGKATVVRAYVQAAPDARGPWHRVSARLSASGAARPLVPANRYDITAPADGSDRRTLDDSFAFVLEPAMTQPGTRTFEVRLVPPDGRAQSDLRNDVMRITVRFGPRVDRLMYGWTYATTANGRPERARPPFSDFEPHRRVTENAHPVSWLRLSPLPGYPLMTFDNSRGEAYLDAHNWLKYEVARIFPQGGQDVHLLVPNDALNGWCCTGEGNSSVHRGENSTSEPGLVLAHEWAHRWLGNDHTYDVAGYPYPRSGARAEIGDNVGIRLAPRLETAPGTAAPGARLHYDTLSYGSPAWPSPYTYCRLLAVQTATALTCDAATSRAGARALSSLPPARGAAAAPDALGLPAGKKRFLHVEGVLYPDGSARWGTFEQLSTSLDLTSPSTGKAYRVVIQDRGGKELAAYGLDRRDDVHDGPTPIPFGAFLPWDAAAARVVLYGPDGKQLAARDISAHAPSVELLGVRGAQRLTGRRTIRWSGSDPDGDSLTYSVEYSADGRRWLPLAVGVRGTSVSVDFGAVPPAARARLRVLASDGMHTSSDGGDRSVTVPAAAPRVQISAPRAKLVRPGQPIVLSGQALDWLSATTGTVKAYEWRSSRQGRLGSGPMITPRLVRGRHTITLSVRDGTGRTGRATLTLHVGGRPWAS